MSVSTWLARTQMRHFSFKKVISWYSGLVKAKSPEAPYEHVVQIGDPTLRAVSLEIPSDLVKSPEIKFLIDRMRKVMRKYKCVGLAAPQIGAPFRLFVMEFAEEHLQDFSEKERESREMQIVPFTVVINPSVRVTDYKKLTFTEYCASVKGFQAEVPRCRGVHLTGLNEENERFEMECVGWPARIVQHEMDHLNGRVYTDVMDRKSLACSCWQVVNERGGKVELPYGAH